MGDKLHIALTSSRFDLDAPLFDLLKDRWITFAKHNKLDSFANTDVFSALHLLKTEILKIYTIKLSLQKLERKRQIEFYLQRFKAFAIIILRYRIAETAIGVTRSHLSIISEIDYLRALLNRLAPG